MVAGNRWEFRPVSRPFLLKKSQGIAFDRTDAFILPEIGGRPG